MFKNKNVAFFGFLFVLAASELGLLHSLSALVHQYGDLWKNLLSATGFGGVAVAVIDKLLSLIK